MRMVAIALSMAVMSLGLAGCECMSCQGHKDGKHEMHHPHDGKHVGMHGKPGEMHGKMGDAASMNKAVAVIYPTKGSSVSGAITFTPAGDSMRVQGTINGLTPNGTHAIHIHEFGDQTSDNGESAGTHYNPGGHKHGGPDSAERHPGDFGNLKADGSGTARIDLTVKGISIGGREGAPILGRSIVIHAKPDDFSQPTGNAGDRIGVGVIGVAKAAP
jgi:Cu-Zn family superoxide dismutase